MNPLVISLVLLGVAVLVSLGTMAMVRPMARPCPRCDSDVRLDTRACGGCGYAFR